jgi:probable rRNA maturation factor
MPAPGSPGTARAVPAVVVSLDGGELLGDDADERARRAEHLTALVERVLRDRSGPQTIEVGLRFVDADEMALLNAEHMGHDGSTDVLSFPMDGDPADGPSGPDVPDGPPWLLGDLVICPAVAAANAPAHAGSYDDELALLVVHGVLHLLGMDHAEPEETATMQARERELLDAHHGPMAGDPWSAALRGEPT